LHPAKPLDYLYKYLLSEFWILPSKMEVRPKDGKSETAPC
jgi:hypothetical protein